LEAIGRTIVAVKSDADRPLREAEVAYRQDFALAAAWAKAALQDEELRLFYEALEKQREIPAPRSARRSRYGHAAEATEKKSFSRLAGKINSLNCASGSGLCESQSGPARLTPGNGS